MHRKIRASIGDHAHKSPTIPMLIRWNLAIGHLGHTSVAVAIPAVFLSNVRTYWRSPSFPRLLFAALSLTNASTSRPYPPIADSKSGSRSCEHLFSRSKINFSSLLLRQASRITPTSRGFDGSLFRVLRTCENKNTALLGREADAFTRLRKENFRNTFAKCSPMFH